MEHVALYRQFRPQNFDEIVEQKAPVATLRQSVKVGRIGHAYLFCGQRGTGKTSIARVFARAINCENPENGNPCNKCSTCKGILDGSLMDVIEIDAASNRSIDNIRKICEEVTYAPSKAPHKVYIIDEVHMITSEGFNALLKTLEEPPKHAVFLFATTEPHSIPATILSRCQRFDFRRIPQDSIISRLKYICDHEKISINDDALKLIASLSDGAMRDAISMLDQAASSAQGKLVTAESIEEMTGSVNKDFLADMADVLLEGKFDELLILSGKLAESGRDTVQFTLDLASYFRDLLIVRTLPDPTKLLTTSETTLKRMYEIASKTNSNTLVAFISSLSKTVSELKWSPSVRTTFEITLLRLCGRKIKADEVPLVIPDFAKKQAEAAKTIPDKFSNSSSEESSKPSAVPEFKTIIPSLKMPTSLSTPEPVAPKEEPVQAPTEKAAEEPAPLTTTTTPAPVEAPKAPETEVPAPIATPEIPVAPVVAPAPAPTEETKPVQEEAPSEPIAPAIAPEETEKNIDDEPLENQIDLFSMDDSSEDSAPVETKNEVVNTEPKVEPKPESKTASKSNIFADISSNFLDDIKLSDDEEQTQEESDVYKPTGRIGETKKTRLSEILDTTPIAESKVVKELTPMEVWANIINKARSEDFTLSTLLNQAQFKYEDNSAFILFANEDKKIIKDLTADPSYKSISTDLKREIKDCSHVYLCTEIQYQNMLMLKNGGVSKQAYPQSKAESFINSSKEIGINTEIHFGDD